MERRQIPMTSWIWTDAWTHADTETPKIVYFRRILNLEKEVVSFKVDVSADSRYRLIVNGNSVCVGPCKGDNMVWYHETVDLKDYLVTGDNAICAVVLRYPTDKKYNHSVWRTANPALYIDGAIEYADGETVPFKADNSFKSFINYDIEITREGGFQTFLYVQEIAKGNPALNGWLTADYDDSAWAGTHAYSHFEMSKAISPGSVSPRPIPLLYENKKSFAGVMAVRQSAHTEAEWLAFLAGAPIEIAANSEEIVEINAEYNTTGYLNLRVAGGADANIEILCSESYYIPRNDPNARRQSAKVDRTDCVNGHLEGYTDNYTVAGFGTDSVPEAYEPFWFRAFRFVKLTIKTGDAPVKLLGFDYRETGYPLKVISSAFASDKDFKGIWDISLNSLRRCMHETYEDCPFYEQLQYAMDTRSQILFTYMLGMDDRMARRTIDDFHRCRRPDGMINCCYPSYGPNIIPGFSIYYILMIHDHMMYFGDKELVRKYFPTVDGILGYFSRCLDERGLVDKIGGILGRHHYWSYVDWAPEWGRTVGVPDAILDGPITMESLLYTFGLNAAAELAEYIGRDGVAAEYRARANSVKDAIRKYCMGSNGLIQDGPGIDKYSQHCQIFGVLTDFATGDEAAHMIDNMLHNKSLAQCSVSFCFYMFRALEKAGLYDQTEVVWAPWREMLENHLTTCVENATDGRSDCHAWGSVIIYELLAVILGVRPAKPGYAAVSVNPNLGYLDWAEGSVITPKGLVTVSAKKENGEVKTEITIPEGLEVI